jgi:hypothetical protein
VFGHRGHKCEEIDVALPTRRSRDDARRWPACLGPVLDPGLVVGQVCTKRASCAGFAVYPRRADAAGVDGDPVSPLQPCGIGEHEVVKANRSPAGDRGSRSSMVFYDVGRRATSSLAGLGTRRRVRRRYRRPLAGFHRLDVGPPGHGPRSECDRQQQEVRFTTSASASTVSPSVTSSRMRTFVQLVANAEHSSSWSCGPGVPSGCCQGDAAEAGPHR